MQVGYGRRFICHAGITVWIAKFLYAPHVGVAGFIMSPGGVLLLEGQLYSALYGGRMLGSK